MEIETQKKRTKTNFRVNVFYSFDHLMGACTTLESNYHRAYKTLIYVIKFDIIEYKYNIELVFLLQFGNLFNLFPAARRAVGTRTKDTKIFIFMFDENKKK
jgi:hypothetical protein